MLQDTKLRKQSQGQVPAVIRSSNMEVWGWVSLNSDNYLQKPTCELIIRNHFCGAIKLQLEQQV